MTSGRDDKAVVALNQERRRIGQTHPRAIHSDAEVDSHLFEESRCMRWPLNPHIN